MYIFVFHLINNSNTHRHISNLRTNVWNATPLAASTLVRSTSAWNIATALT